jgi:hypothetical protein
MNQATDVKFMSVVKDSCCRASGAFTYPDFQGGSYQRNVQAELTRKV